MIRKCGADDFATVLAVVNEAAEAYRGVIPPDCWHRPYMPASELRAEIAAGVVFWAVEEEGRIRGVMGLQTVGDVDLIRHAYVRPADQRRGVGTALLRYLAGLGRRPLLVGTWAAATWAIRFYEKAGFRLVSPAEKDRLLRRYWSVSERQIETSVVLADRRWKGSPDASADRPPPRVRRG